MEAEIEEVNSDDEVIDIQTNIDMSVPPLMAELGLEIRDFEELLNSGRIYEYI